MEPKIGDKVKIKPVSELEQCADYVDDLNIWAGKIMTIGHITFPIMSKNDSCIKMVEDKNEWWWNTAMFDQYLKKTNRDIFLEMTNDELTKVLNCSCCEHYNTKNCPSKFNEEVCREGTNTWLEKEVDQNAEI